MAGEDLNSKKLNILAIDDDETILKLYKNLLSEDGHTVKTVKTAKDAKAAVNEQSIDCVFLDLKLPDANGMDLLKEIKGKIKFAPVIIVTANPSLQSSIEAIREGGVYEYIIKPFKKEELVRVLRSALEKAELIIENSRLVKKLARTNQALLERVDELEACAKFALEYEGKINELNQKIQTLKKQVGKKS